MTHNTQHFSFLRLLQQRLFFWLCLSCGGEKTFYSEQSFYFLFFVDSFFSVIPDRDKSFTTRETHEDKRKDKTGDDDLFGDDDNDSDQELKTIPFEAITDPPRKIHRGLEANDEVEDTLDWLNEHGVNRPSDTTEEEVPLEKQVPDPDLLPTTAKPLTRSKNGSTSTVSNLVKSRTSETETNKSHSSFL